MKKTENLQISCEPEDLAQVDSLRGQFHAFPPKRSEIARVLLRFAIAKVRQQPGLLKAICRLFEEQVIADIEGIETLSAHQEAAILRCMAMRQCSRHEAFDYIFNHGVSQGEMCAFQDAQEEAGRERLAG